jgi:hypothetical protein
LSKARPRDHDDDGAAGAADDDGDDHRGAAIIVIAALAVDTVRSKRLSERRGLVVVERAFRSRASQYSTGAGIPFLVSILMSGLGDASPTFPTGALILEFCRRKLNLFKGR